VATFLQTRLLGGRVGHVFVDAATGGKGWPRFCRRGYWGGMAFYVEVGSNLWMRDVWLLWSQRLDIGVANLNDPMQFELWCGTYELIENDFKDMGSWWP
jgi:hypothetical protein